MSTDGVSHARNTSRGDCTFGSFLIWLAELMCEPRAKFHFV